MVELRGVLRDRLPGGDRRCRQTGKKSAVGTTPVAPDGPLPLAAATGR